ncbi:hypothetical protein KSS87_003467 [Heliosperma pusillum]|nr:hypothetical protein KSS87_003467 [Heliosperma pusillum]
MIYDPKGQSTCTIRGVQRAGLQRAGLQRAGPGWKRAGLWEREPEPTLRARGVRAGPGRAGDLVALDRPDWEKMGAGQCGLGGLGVWAGENGARDRPGLGERVGRAGVAGQRAGEVGARTRVTDPRRTTFDPEPEIDIEQPGQRTEALEPIVVAAIPTMKFHRDAFGSDDDAQCSICLGDYQEKEILRLMPKCGHSFHLSCIDLWLMKQSTCPVCRLPVRDPLDLKHTRSVSITDSRSSIPNAEIPISHSIGNGNAGDQLDDHSTSQNPGFS